MTAVYKHELKSYFHSLIGYMFCSFMLLFVGIGAMMYNIQSAVANFEYVLEFVCICLVVIIPVLTMRVISEERKQKTDQLLYSLPLKATQIVLGKFFALLTVYLIPVLIISVYPLVFANYGEVYLPTSYGSLAAFFFLGAALIAVGTFVSSLTDNQGFAAGITIAIFLFNYFSVKLANYASETVLGSVIALLLLLLLLAFVVKLVTKSSLLALLTAALGTAATTVTAYFKEGALEGLLPDIMEKLSLFERFYGFVDGVFDVTSLVFYLTVTVFFLFLTVQSLEKRRYN